jgi:hypothetical protein
MIYSYRCEYCDKTYHSCKDHKVYPECGKPPKIVYGVSPLVKAYSAYTLMKLAEIERCF